MSDAVLASAGLVVVSAADMARQLSNHGPSGDAWPEDPDSVYQQELLALAPTFSRLNDRANYLVTDMYPGTSVELLPEWERSVGLPDPCSGPDPTIALRQLHVIARLTYRGGQSVPYFVGYAASLGYAITIEEFVPARYGRRNYGKPRYGQDWAHAWRVHAPGIVVTPARYGQHRSGEPYAAWQQNSLLCELNRIKPAHTILQLAYSYAPRVARWGYGVWGHDTWGA